MDESTSAPATAQGATSAAPAAESAAPAPSAPAPSPAPEPTTSAPTPVSEEATTSQAPEATADPVEASAPTGDATAASMIAPPRGTETDPSGSPEPETVLSQTDPAPPEPESAEPAPSDAPETTALSPVEAAKAVLDGLAPHEKAELFGVPEEYRKEGYFYYDENEGHWKGDDPAKFFGSRGFNDKWVSDFRKEKEAIVGERDEYKSKYEEAVKSAGQTDAILKGVFGIDGATAGYAEAFVTHFMEDEELKGLNPDEIVDDDLRSRYYMEYARAQDRRDAYFKEVEAESEARQKAQEEAVERGARYFTEKVTPEAFGADSHDLQAALGTTLQKPVAAIPGATVADVVRDLAALAGPEVADIFLKGLKVDVYALAQEPLPFAEASRGSRDTGTTAVRDKTTERADSPAQETPAAAPEPSPEPTPAAPVAPVQRPVVETSIETSAALPAAPASRPKPDYTGMKGRDLIASGTGDAARRRRK